MEAIKLKKFDMSSITGNNAILFIGKSCTGKSVLLIDYLYYNQDIPYACCISPEDNYNLTLPSKYIHKKVNPLLIESFQKRQAQLSKKKRDYPDKEIDNRGILIIDDCLADAKDLKWIFTII